MRGNTYAEHPEPTMSFQAYIDNVKKKTGKTPDQFKTLAKKKGLLGPSVKAGAVIAWLKADYDLGHGHAMAIYATFKSAFEPKLSVTAQIDRHFAGARAAWRKTYARLMRQVEKFGSDVSVDPTDTYLSILRKGKKFAIVQLTADRFDVGIKLKGLKPDARFKASGKWNAMVTHRVRIETLKDVDAEIERYLREAYDRV